MPRDLFGQSPPPMVASPESQTPKQEGGEETATQANSTYNEFTIHRDERQFSLQETLNNRAKADGRNEIHPYVQALTLSDLESCIELENAGFPPQERSSREKFIHRLTSCPELCLGLFSTLASTQDPASVPTYSTARPPDSSQPQLKQTLIAMIVATKTTTPTVTDASMEFPPDHGAHPPSPDERRGHVEDGRTICIHSFVVLPSYQKKGLGRVLMRSYQQRMETCGIADRIALLTHEPLEAMYKSMGYGERGTSEVKFGGGGWTDMIYEFATFQPGE